MDKILTVQLTEIDEMLQNKKIKLNISVSARTWLCNTGYDPHYGARPLKRVIQRYLLNPLAKLLLEGRVRPGDTVRVDTSKNLEGIVIHPNHPPLKIGSSPVMDISGMVNANEENE